MKILKAFSLFLLLVSISALTSCKKDDDSDTGNNNNDDVYLTCKIDGTAFKAEALTVGGISIDNNFSLQGNNGGLDASAIAITLNSSYNGSGTYNLGSDFLTNIALIFL